MKIVSTASISPTIAVQRISANGRYVLRPAAGIEPAPVAGIAVAIHLPIPSRWHDRSSVQLSLPAMFGFGNLGSPPGRQEVGDSSRFHLPIGTTTFSRRGAPPTTRRVHGTWRCRSRRRCGHRKDDDVADITYRAILAPSVADNPPPARGMRQAQPVKEKASTTASVSAAPTPPPSSRGQTKRPGGRIHRARVRPGSFTSPRRSDSLNPYRLGINTKSTRRAKYPTNEVLGRSLRIPPKQKT
jgi:hypothetical protein